MERNGLHGCTASLGASLSRPGFLHLRTSSKSPPSAGDGTGTSWGSRGAKFDKSNGSAALSALTLGRSPTWRLFQSGARAPRWTNHGTQQRDAALCSHASPGANPPVICTLQQKRSTGFQPLQAVPARARTTVPPLSNPLPLIFHPRAKRGNH